MRTQAFAAVGEEPCDPTDIFSPCFDPGILVDDPQSPGPDVGGGPGAAADCDPTDIFSECYDPSIPLPADPQSPGPDVSDPPVDLTDPKYQSKFPPLSRNWLDDLLNGAIKAGGDVLEGIGKGEGGGGTGAGSGGGGSGNGAGSGEGEMTDKTKLFLLAGAGVLLLSGVLK